MAKIDLSLGALFEQAFGYKTTAFDPKFVKVPVGPNNVDPGLPNRKEKGDYGSPYYQTLNGAEYYLPVTITYSGGSTDSPDGAVSLPDKIWTLPNCIVSIRSRKTFVETQLTERPGPVVEFINKQGYEIGIKGFLIGKAREFPEADMKTLIELWEQNSEVTIACALTDVALVATGRKAYIKDLHLPEVKGIKNVRPYDLTLMSVVPYNLEDIS